MTEIIKNEMLFLCRLYGVVATYREIEKYRILKESPTPQN
jgi:hypothetical protein